MIVGNGANDTLERYGTRSLMARVKKSKNSTLTKTPKLNVNNTLESEARILHKHPKQGFNALKTRRLTQEYYEKLNRSTIDSARRYLFQSSRESTEDAPDF